jgi:hypothetical protein
LKDKKFATLLYRPGPVPTDLPASAQRYLSDELNRIAALLQIMATTMQESSARMFAQDSSEPASPVTPMLAYADGVTWDPGSGEGYYYFNSNNEWTPLG